MSTGNFLVRFEKFGVARRTKSSSDQMALKLDDLRSDKEYSLLLHCCRARVREADMAAQRQLADGLDSDRFLALVERHLVAPLAACRTNAARMG